MFLENTQSVVCLKVQQGYSLIFGCDEMVHQTGKEVIQYCDWFLDGNVSSSHITNM